MGSVSGRSPSCSQACASGSGAHRHTHPETRDERANRRRCTARRLAGRVACWAGQGGLRRDAGELLEWGMGDGIGWDGWMGNIGRGRTSSELWGERGQGWHGLAMTRRSIWRTDKLPEGLGASTAVLLKARVGTCPLQTGALARPARSVSSNPITAPRLHQSSPRSALAPSPTPTPIYHPHHPPATTHAAPTAAPSASALHATLTPTTTTPCVASCACCSDLADTPKQPFPVHTTTS